MPQWSGPGSAPSIRSVAGVAMDGWERSRVTVCLLSPDGEHQHMSYPGVQQLGDLSTYIFTLLRFALQLSVWWYHL